MGRRCAVEGASVLSALHTFQTVIGKGFDFIALEAEERTAFCQQFDGFGKALCEWLDYNFDPLFEGAILLLSKGQGKALPLKGFNLKPKVPQNLVKGLKIDEKILNKIPKELGDAKLAKDGPGLRWFDNKADKSIRIMKGDKKLQYEHQHNDYVQLRSGGQVVLKDGSKIKNPASGEELRKLKDAHIPYEEWIQWRTWNKP